MGLRPTLARKHQNSFLGNQTCTHSYYLVSHIQSIFFVVFPHSSFKNWTWVQDLHLENIKISNSKPNILFSGTKRPHLSSHNSIQTQIQNYLKRTGLHYSWTVFNHSRQDTEAHNQRLDCQANEMNQRKFNVSEPEKKT